MKGRLNAVIWYLQRITGILLIIGLGIHFWVLHFANKTGEYLYEEVAKRLSQPEWKVFYIVFLIVVIYHAMVGVRMILNDFRLPASVKSLFGFILFVIGVALFIWGTNSLLAVRLPG